MSWITANIKKALAIAAVSGAAVTEIANQINSML